MKWLFGKKFTTPPPHIEADLCAFGDTIQDHPFFLHIEKAGVYCNVTLDLKACYDTPYVYPAPPHPEALVEYGSPNANKAFHLGHLRNLLIGDCFSNMLEFLGCEVERVSLVNDRGVDVFKALSVYRESDMRKPQDMKLDKFVGMCYTAYEAEGRSDAHDLQKLWERGDSKTFREHQNLVEQVFLGHLQTMDRLEMSEMDYVFESEVYKEGVKIVKTRDDVFTKEDDGSLSFKGEKTVLRSDGTSLYITQDIGVAVSRAGKPCYYVVASPQKHHFKTLFSIMEEVEPSFEGIHLSYGMVELPDGKMKSRLGRVVEVEDLFEEMLNTATPRMWNKNRYSAYPVVTAALKFHFLDYALKSTVRFNPDESLSHEGRTGPYVLYTIARLDSLLEKMSVGVYDGEAQGPERDLVLLMLEWPDIFAEIKPNRVTKWLYFVCKAFNTFYGSTKFVGHVREEELAALFLRLRGELARGMKMLGCEVPEKVQL